MGVPYSTYYATKAAMIHLTRTTAVQYAPKHIRVNAVLPGLMKTPMVEKTAGLTAEYARAMLSRCGRFVMLNARWVTWAMLRTLRMLACILLRTSLNTSPASNWSSTEEFR
jgi:NAD(P)-dependent dehydrogenase (short-subunit alcohol dehydrogenase family)